MFPQRPRFSCLLSLVSLFFLPPPVSAVEEAFCAALRWAHYRTENGETQVRSDVYTGGATSMGDQFWYHFDFNSVWAANHVRRTYVDKNLPDQPVLDVYAVRGKRANGVVEVIPGWLHLKLRRKNGLPIHVLAIWARTEYKESIGTFVNVDTKCGSAKIDTWDSGSKGAKWLPPASVVPCAGTPVFSPMNPNMAVYVARGVGGYDPVNEVHLLWKLDMSVCDNIRDGFKFWVAIPPEEYMTKGPKLDVGKTHGRLILNPNADPNDPSSKYIKYPEIGPYVFTTGKISATFFGAAAPMFEASDLSCGEAGLHIYHPDFKKNVDWLTVDSFTPTNGAVAVATKDYNEPSPIKDSDDDTANPFLRWQCGPLPNPGSPPPGYGCPYTPDNPWPQQNDLVNIYRPTCKPRLGQEQDKNTPKKGYKAFWGRCEDEISNVGLPEPIPDGSPKCPHGNSPTIKNWPSHYDFGIDMQRHEELNQGCQCPPIPDLDDVKMAKPRDLQFEDATPYSVEGDGCKQVKSVKELDRLGLCKDSVAGRSAMTVRLWHAYTMLFTVMVVNSVSSYMARYLKGTLPVTPNTGRYHIPLTKWYLIHIGLVVPTICMYITCLSSMNKQTDILGYSLEPYAIYHRYIGWGVMCAFGFQMLSGFLRPLNVCCRRIFIFIHWACGEIVHRGAAVLCIMTYKIPSSPFSYLSHLDGNFNQIFYHAAPLIMMLWLAWDFLFHGYTMVYIIKYDRSHDVCLGFCQYFPVLIPRVETRRFRPEKHAAKRDRDLRRLAWGHATMCVMMYALLISVLKWWPNLDNHGFGVMKCTHTHDGQFNLDAANTTYILQHKKFCPDF